MVSFMGVYFPFNISLKYIFLFFSMSTYYLHKQSYLEKSNLNDISFFSKGQNRVEVRISSVEATRHFPEGAGW